MSNTFTIKKKSLVARFCLQRCLLLILFVLMGGALSFSQNQKVNIKGTDITIQSAFKQIEKQTKLTIGYDESVIDVNQRINGKIHSQILSEALAEVLKGTGTEYFFQNKHIIIRSITQPNTTATDNAKSTPSKIVTGTVVDAKTGDPIIGAVVAMKGTNIKTVTDFNGKFSIDTSNESNMTVSYIGYAIAEVNIGSKRSIDIKLDEDSKELDEVIVMGYSSQKKSELSSATVTLNANELKGVTTSDVGNLLQGKVAGLVVSNSSGQPGTSAEIRIRGTGSITADADPLYVVDGIPGGSFNPNDVQTITVLKDAGATALYGSAAAGGVIVVTTKSGSKNQPTHIDVKANAGIKSSLFGHFKMMDSKELYYMQKELFSAALFSILRPSSLLHQDFNWQDAFFKTGAIQDYYVSATGSNDKTTYYAGLDYYNEKGTLINTGYQKVSGRLNLNTQLYKNLDMNIRLSYTNSNIQSTSSWTTLNDAYTKMPWDSPYGADGKLENITSGTRADGSTWYSQDKWNSLYNEQYNYNKTHSYQFISDFQVNWTILDWLVFTTSNRYSQDTYKNVLFIDPRTYSSEYADGYLSNEIGVGNSFGTTNTLKSNNKFGLHSINGLLGWEWGQSTTETTLSAGTGMPDGMDALNASQIYEIGGNTIPLRSYSGFGQVQYSYNNKYFATSSLRADANSKFAQKRRLGWFPSGAASWLISNEDFLKKNKIITFLKLRGSYGLTGNSNIGMYQYLSSYSLSSSYQNVVAATPTRLANQYLGWEKAYMAGLGLDIKLWRSIELNIDVYNTDNKDLLLAVPVSPSTGFFEITANAGSVRNQGIEFQINTVNLKTKDINWESGFNIGFNKNRVTETPNDEAFLQTRSSVSQQIKRGQDIYSWYMPKWLGVDPTNGDPLWEKIVYNDAGEIINRVSTNDYTEATFQVVGKATPIFSGGFTNTVSYKGFYLNLNANFVYGNKIFNYNRLALDADGAYLGYNQMSFDNGLGWTRWEKEGDIATHPKLVMNGNKSSNSISSRYLENGSFLRIKNVKLGYELPGNLLKKIHISSCNIYLSGDNILTFSRFSGMDPEVTLRTSTYTLAGLYVDNYPVSRQILMGLELGF